MPTRSGSNARSVRAVRVHSDPPQLRMPSDVSDRAAPVELAPVSSSGPSGRRASSGTASVSASADLFLPSADELATAEGDIADARDPTLTFTPNVLAADGFKRSRLTRRYVDAATERDFLAFVARDRWARVPLAFLFPLEVAVYYEEWQHPGFSTPRQRMGWVVIVALSLWGFLAAVLSSAGVVERLPFRRVSRRVLSRDARAFLASTILAVPMLVEAACFVFSEIGIRYTRLLRPPGSADDDGASSYTVRPPMEAFGPALYAVMFPCRTFDFVPVALVSVAAIVLNHFLRFFDGTFDDAVWYCTVITAYLMGGLIAIAWEEQQRAHFRARASAAWQAGRGAKLVDLITDTCRRCKPTHVSGAVAQVQPADGLAMYAVVSFKCHLDGLSADRMLGLKKCLCICVGDVVAALLLDAVVFGGGGDGILVAIAGAQRESALAALAGAGEEQRLICAVLTAKLVASLVADQWGGDGRVFSAGVADGPLQCLRRATGSEDVLDVVDVVGPAAVDARQLAERWSGSWSVLLSTDIVKASRQIDMSQRPAPPDGSMMEDRLAYVFELHPVNRGPHTAAAAGRGAVHRRSGLPEEPTSDRATGFAVGDIIHEALLAQYRRFEASLFFQMARREEKGGGESHGSAVEVHSTSAIVDGDGAGRWLTTAQRSSHQHVSRRSDALPSSGGLVPEERYAATETVRRGAGEASGDRASARDASDVAGAGSPNDAELVAADKAVSVKHVWRLLSGLTFEEDAVEARYRAQENAGATRHVVVFASAWLNVLLGVMYACRGLADTGTLVWIFFGLAVLSTAAMWAVLRPAKPGQRRWVAASIGLHPVQSVALLCALHFHPDPTNPAKLHQYWVTLQVTLIFIFTIPTTVPFFIILAVGVPIHWATISWGAHLIPTSAGDRRYWSFASGAVAVAIYGSLISAVRVRSRLAFADHVMSQRSAGRWARARRTLRRRLAAVVPAAVAEAAVLQLTARIGKARRGASYSAIDAALEEEEGPAGASSEDGLVGAGAGEGRLFPAPGVEFVSPSRRNDGNESDEDERDAPPSTELGSLRGCASTSIRVPTATVLLLTLDDSGGDMCRSRSATAPRFVLDPGAAVGDVDLPINADFHAEETARLSLRTPDRPTVERLVGAARAITSMLRLHPHTAVESATGLFVSRHGPCGWLIVAGMGGARGPTDPARLFNELAGDITLLPEVAAHGGLRSGTASGEAVGDVVTVGGELRYEVVGPAVEQAFSELCDEFGPR